MQQEDVFHLILHREIDKENEKLKQLAKKWEESDRELNVQTKNISKGFSLLLSIRMSKSRWGTEE